MATSPVPPRPPSPPAPPRSNSNYVAIAFLLLALIVVVVGVAIWGGLGLLSSAVHIHVNEQGAGKKEVSISTPVGSLEVNKGVNNEASLGLPIYPGATHMPDKDSATVNIDIADETKVQVLAGKFETTDSIDKVRDFYHVRLGDQVTKYRDRDDNGKTVFELKHDKQEKIVTLKDDGGRTVIDLVRISEGTSQAN
jgi:hypothetical protein